MQGARNTKEEEVKATQEFKVGFEEDGKKNIEPIYYHVVYRNS